MGPTARNCDAESRHMHTIWFTVFTSPALPFARPLVYQIHTTKRVQERNRPPRQTLRVCHPS